MNKKLSFTQTHPAKKSHPLVRLSLLLAVLLILPLLSPLPQSLGLPAAAYAETTDAKPLAGKTISVMGDSISTYTGWSDAYPIASEEYANRYGEAYYGPAGGDFHNTDMLVTDTWWHQAAEELGAEILMSNAGNSTGLLWASYPSLPAWEQYLNDLLMYKSRP